MFAGCGIVGDEIGEFWANFINRDETTDAEVTLELEVDPGPGFFGLYGPRSCLRI
jgi:hypothetical protein